MQRARRRLLILLLTAAAAFPAIATPTTYNITFSPYYGSTGGTPTGSFTYDPSTPAFSNFIVDYDMFVFNLTASANAPTATSGGFPACVGSDTGAKASFDLLSGECPQSAYNGVVFPSNANFLLHAPETGCGDNTTCISISATDISSAPMMMVSNGQFSISPVTAAILAPEPNSTGLTLAGVILCATVGIRSSRRRIGHVRP